jgi:hypothetical protein
MRQLKEFVRKSDCTKFALGLLEAAEVSLGNQCDGGARRLDRQRANEAPIALGVEEQAGIVELIRDDGMVICERDPFGGCRTGIEGLTRLLPSLGPEPREKRFNMMRTPRKRRSELSDGGSPGTRSSLVKVVRAQRTLTREGSPRGRMRRARLVAVRVLGLDQQSTVLGRRDP